MRNLNTKPAISPGLLPLYLSLLLLSVNGLFARSIDLDSTSITHLRSVIAAAALLALLLLRGTPLRLPCRRTAITVYGLGILLGLHWVTFFKAMQVSSVAVGIIALFSYPVITVLIEPLFQHRKPKWPDLAAALLVLTGVAIMVSGQDTGLGNIREGVFWGACSAFLFSLRNTSQKYWLHHIPSSGLMLHQVIATALMLSVFTDWSRVANLNSHNWLLLALLGLICTAGAHTLLSLSLKNLAAKSVALISCLQPVLASALAWLVLAETPSTEIILGGLVVISVATYESLKR
ncbi:DMT family transporter [Teredinibacter haidensis]|uniref:DMT family transporter n=1 Tax=Teredinibacter haidensis TaxID=2731755 RepID=UPI000B2B5FCA|nr:DMT family transporter [Teredinibacter haidensis]